MTIYIYFIKHRNTNKEYQETVKNTVLNFKNQIRKNKYFLNNFTFHICDSYESIGSKSPLTKAVSKDADSFRYTGGMTLPIIENNNKKEIIIKTSNPSVFNIMVNKKMSDVTQVTMHEIGHQFDDQFGDCSPQLLAEVKKLPLGTDDEGTKEQQELYDKYQKNKDLSDSKEFKKAWKLDAEALGKNNLSNFLFKHNHIDYYVFDVDITDGITEKEVEDADYHRSEIFAQLFSYAMGEDDGQKKEIVKKFKNCYTIIKSFIKQYLGIDIKND